MTVAMITNNTSTSLERLKCAGKITGVTAKWVVGWPVIGVYEYARSCHSWRKNDLVSRSTTTFHPRSYKKAPACGTCDNSLQAKPSLPQDGAEKFFKGLGLTVWFVRHWVFVAPRFMVEECRLVHMQHKQKLYATVA